MGDTTRIKDYDHTLNFWMGCTKQSEGCLHCYAEAMNKRYNWIPDFTKDTMTKQGSWKNPYKWQKQAARKREVHLVFCNSLSDFWHPSADQWRSEAWKIIKDTPNLIWRIQPKRPELIAERLPNDWGDGYPNVWLTVTVELKKYLSRLDIQNQIPAAAHCLNAEPLLEDLTPELADHVEGLDYIWVGGENGPQHRPFNMQWARNIRDLCKQHNIPLTFGGAGGVHQRDALLDGVKHTTHPRYLKAYRKKMRGSPKAASCALKPIQLIATAAH